MGGEVGTSQRLFTDAQPSLSVSKTSLITLNETINNLIDQKRDLEWQRESRLESASKYSLRPETSFKEARELARNIKQLEKQITELQFARCKLVATEEQPLQDILANANNDLSECQLDEFRSVIEALSNTETNHQQTYQAILIELDTLFEQLSENRSALTLIDTTVAKIISYLKQTQNVDLLNIIKEEQEGAKLRKKLCLLCLENMMDRMVELQQSLPATEKKRNSHMYWEMRSLELITFLMLDKVKHTKNEDKQTVELDYYLAKKKFLELKIAIALLEDAQYKAIEQQYKDALKNFEDSLCGHVRSFLRGNPNKTFDTSLVESLYQDVIQANSVLLTTRFDDACTIVEERLQGKIVVNDLEDFRIKTAVAHRVTAELTIGIPQAFLNKPTEAKLWDVRQKQKACIDQIAAFSDSLNPEKPSSFKYMLNRYFGFYDREIKRYEILILYKHKINTGLGKLRDSDYYQTLLYEELSDPNIKFSDPVLASTHIQMIEARAKLKEVTLSRTQREQVLTDKPQDELRDAQINIGRLSNKLFIRLPEDDRRVPVCEGFYLKLGV